MDFIGVNKNYNASKLYLDKTTVDLTDIAADSHLHIPEQ